MLEKSSFTQYDPLSKLVDYVYSNSKHGICYSDFGSLSLSLQSLSNSGWMKARSWQLSQLWCNIKWLLMAVNVLWRSLHSKGTLHKHKLDKASMVIVGWWRVCVGSRELGSACLDVGQNWDYLPKKIHPMLSDIQVYCRLESCKKFKARKPMLAECLGYRCEWGVGNRNVYACISFQDKQGYVAHTVSRAERRLWFSTKRFISFVLQHLSKTFMILFWKDCNKT